MRIGTYYFIQVTPGRPAPTILREELDQMVLSEELGFDSVWLTEHHYSDYGMSSAPSVLAATVAARTARVSIGLAVYVLPFHHPLRLAEETATLDILSQGRLVVGLARGNRPLEFVGHGVSQDESRTRMEEGVEVMLQAWTQDRVTFHGRHWHFDDIPVYPKPLTQPHPPLAFAVISPASVQWAANRGDRILSSGLHTPLPRLREMHTQYAEALRGAGHPPALIDRLLAQWTVTKHVYVADTDAEARADAEGPERWYLDAFIRSIQTSGLQGLSEAVLRESAESTARMRALRWDDLVEDSLLIGSPATVRRKIGELQQAGVGELLCWMNFGGLPPEKVRRSMRLFADEVMPAFQSAPVAASA